MAWRSCSRQSSPAFSLIDLARTVLRVGLRRRASYQPRFSFAIEGTVS
jgi:hypothetical protein